MNEREGCSEVGSKFQFLQANRDLQSNWEVNLAQQLEEYLLKICSGVVIGDEDMHLSINFAEAALVVQGSVQVYSRKVEYLYSLVLHALEFISQKRQEQQEKASVHPDESDSHVVASVEDENFLDLDDVPVEARNCLEESQDGTGLVTRAGKPPANMLVLEGEYLDISGDAGELESYLLATNDLYEDFLLLDPLDAEAVYEFEKRNINKVDLRGSSLRSRTRRSFLRSPVGRVAGSANRSTLPRSPEDNFHQSPPNNLIHTPAHVSIDNHHISHDDFPESTSYFEGQLNAEISLSRDDSDDDEDDPWEPLNPHEPGDLKIKPFAKGKACRQVPNKRNNSVSLFPVAPLDGPISPEFAEVLACQLKFREQQPSHSPPLYEKLRKSLALEEPTNSGFSDNHHVNDDAFADEHQYPVFEEGHMTLLNDVFINADVPGPSGQQNEDPTLDDICNTFEQEELPSQTSLEDLCRSHLDALLASIAEHEKQTELAARVMTWKHGIENAMQEQDSHPPFDIHEYGEHILERLASMVGAGSTMSFADIVNGQPDYDIARTFSALLQLVNNGNVDIERGEWMGKSFCFTAENPFFVRFTGCREKHSNLHICNSKKRMKSPARRVNAMNTGELGSSEHLSQTPVPQLANGKYSVKLGKSGTFRCTPNGKKRRKSRPVNTVDVQFAQ